VHIGVSDSDALRDFAMNALTTRPEVAHLETGLIFSCVEAGEGQGTAVPAKGRR
jgi:hypothetical protein